LSGTNNSIGKLVREWRKGRRYSQLSLALEMGISAKHISFVETNRANPSKELIIQLGEFFHLPKNEINRGLCLAGFKPFYTELRLNDGALKPVLDAIDLMMRNHMPYPALVLNKYWDIIKTNDSANSLLIKMGYQGYDNLIEAIIADNPQTSHISNWQESIYGLVFRLRNEIALLGGSSRLEKLEARLADHIGKLDDTIISGETPVIPSTQIRIDDASLSFFSVISQLSTIQDVTISEYRVELMFPTDDATRLFYQH